MSPTRSVSGLRQSHILCVWSSQASTLLREGIFQADDGKPWTKQPFKVRYLHQLPRIIICDLLLCLRQLTIYCRTENRHHFRSPTHPEAGQQILLHSLSNQLTWWNWHRHDSGLNSLSVQTDGAMLQRDPSSEFWKGPVTLKRTWPLNWISMFADA